MGSFMQTRFQIREIDLSKGYCLIVTDKTHTEVTFGFDNLGAQLRRLEKFLVYSDDSKQELATVNLLVQRNIPVTFAKSPAEVINETIDPAEVPRVMKAVPVRGQPFETFSPGKPSSSDGAARGRFISRKCCRSCVIRPGSTGTMVCATMENYIAWKT